MASPGEEIYNKRCVACKMVDGRPDFSAYLSLLMADFLMAPVRMAGLRRVFLMVWLYSPPRRGAQWLIILLVY
jgi:hypothetical protein